MLLVRTLGPELNDALTLYGRYGDYESLTLSSYKLTLISRGHT